jgi:hypothetical protein
LEQTSTESDVAGRADGERGAAGCADDVAELRFGVLCHWRILSGGPYERAGAGAVWTLGRYMGRVRQASTATTSAIAATTLPKISNVACSEM